MPSAVFVPAQLNDLSVDVALVSPARGHLPYFGVGSKLTNLAPGTVGQALTLQDVGSGVLEPRWAAPTATDNTKVAKAGDTMTGPLAIQPLSLGGELLKILSGDDAAHFSVALGRSAVEGRIAVPASAGQYATDAAGGDLVVRVENTAKSVRISAGGGLGLQVGSSSVTSPIQHRFSHHGGATNDSTRFAVLVQPGMSPAAYYGPLGVADTGGVLKAYWDQNYRLRTRSGGIAVTRSDGALGALDVYLQFSTVHAVGFSESTDAQEGPYYIGLLAPKILAPLHGSTQQRLNQQSIEFDAININNTTAQSFFAFDAVFIDPELATQRMLSMRGLGSEKFGIAADSSIVFSRKTSTQYRELGRITPAWATATDASRLGRMVFNVLDSSASREGMRLETDGAEPMAGFLGASAIARRSVGAAATDLTSVLTLANNLRQWAVDVGFCKT